MKTIQIKWVYSPKEADEVRVLVDKTSPHGRKLHDLNIDLWCPQVGPSQAILRQLQKQEISLKAFKNLYIHEMLLEPAKFNELIELAQKSSLTLVTAQRDGDLTWIEALKHQLEINLAKANSQ